MEALIFLFPCDKIPDLLHW